MKDEKGYNRVKNLVFHSQTPIRSQGQRQKRGITLA